MKKGEKGKKTIPIVVVVQARHVVVSVQTYKRSTINDVADVHLCAHRAKWSVHNGGDI
jgi:hypothetical protein